MVSCELVLDKGNKWKLLTCSCPSVCSGTTGVVGLGLVGLPGLPWLARFTQILYKSLIYSIVDPTIGTLLKLPGTLYSRIPIVKQVPAIPNKIKPKLDKE